MDLKFGLWSFKGHIKSCPTADFSLTSLKCVEEWN